MYKTKAQLHRAWADVIEMTDSYNKEHKANVNVNDCVKVDGLFVDDIPLFNNYPELYSFAKGILYNECTGVHCPVFIGDKLWSFYTDSWYTVEQYSGTRYTGIFSWNMPKKKETFILHSDKQLEDKFCITRNNYVPCPSSNWTQHVLYLTKNNIGDMFYFDSKEELEEAHKALFTVLTNNKQKGNN